MEFLKFGKEANMHYLVTGGTGYIGSHMAALLHEEGHQVTIVDNFSNSDESSLNRLQSLCNNALHFVQGDVCDREQLDQIFSMASKRGHIDAVLHFAGLKAVGESSKKPLNYYQNNISGTLTLLEVMKAHRVYKMVFSSSATVYGEPERLPLDELCRTRATNPYGQTKLMAEKMLEDISYSHSEWRIACLRYFNPVGAHPSGEIGEMPQGVPNNLMPYVFDVASGKRDRLSVFGDDYDTKDGTGVRDYIHVMDLVEGHLKALEYLSENKGFDTFNLGTGNGYSVLEMIKATEVEMGVDVPYRVSPRRVGDLGTVYASPKKASVLLKWEAKRGLVEMIADQARWVRGQEPLRKRA